MRSFAMLAFVLVSACEEKPEFLPAKPQSVKMPAMTTDVNLPSRLWEELEAVYRPLVFDKASTDDGESKAKLESPKEFFTYHVYLKEKTPGLFVNPNGYDLVFTGTGGMLDFQQILNDRRGSFYLGIMPELKLEKDDKLRVFYQSNAKISKIDGEAFGAGCDKFMDVTGYFKTKMNKEGFFLNTTEGRHAALMAGTYFFAVSLKGKLYLSQLTVRDSRFKKLHCTWK